tara:strand:- start:144 stop:353 length:210 start_codon:yes stop_codon:yes gene_type:complete
MNVTKGKLRKIVNEELKRIYENKELTLNDEERESLSRALGALRSHAQLSRESDVVQWHLAKVEELFDLV